MYSYSFTSKQKQHVIFIKKMFSSNCRSKHSTIYEKKGVKIQMGSNFMYKKNRIYFIVSREKLNYISRHKNFVN